MAVWASGSAIQRGVTTWLVTGTIWIEILADDGDNDGPDIYILPSRGAASRAEDDFPTTSMLHGRYYDSL
jgi:hypothetical protein